MKKICIFLLAAVLFSGCVRQETFETVADELVQSVMAAPREISVQLPDSAAAPVLASADQRVYLGQDYEMMLETNVSGNLNATVRGISGYEADNLTIVQTQQEGLTRHEFVWVSAGEKGDRLGRGVILDDGNYHYCLSVLRDAEGEEASQVAWNRVFSSFTLI